MSNREFVSLYEQISSQTHSAIPNTGRVLKFRYLRSASSSASRDASDWSEFQAHRLGFDCRWPVRRLRRRSTTNTTHYDYISAVAAFTKFIMISDAIETASSLSLKIFLFHLKHQRHHHPRYRHYLNYLHIHRNPRNHPHLEQPPPPAPSKNHPISTLTTT